MKNGKRPTVAQRRHIRWFRLNDNNWLVVKDSPEEFVIVHRLSGGLRKLPSRKGKRGKEEQ